MRLGVVWLDGDRLAIAVERLVVAAKRGQHRAAVVVRLGEFGFQLERAVEAFQRLLVAVERVEDEAVVEQHLRRRRAHAHGGGNEVERLGRLALGELDQRHHLQCVGVIGARGQDLRVERFGLIDLPALMELQRLGESLRDVERSGFGSGCGMTNQSSPLRGKKARLSCPEEILSKVMDLAASRAILSPSPGRRAPSVLLRKSKSGTSQG